MTMTQNAQGFVETAGFVSAIQVADAMAKAAEVRMVMAHKVDGLRVCVGCEGDVAACEAAVNVGAELARAQNSLLGSNVIPRPADGAENLQLQLFEMKKRKMAYKSARLELRIAGASIQTVKKQLKSQQKKRKYP